MGTSDGSAQRKTRLRACRSSSIFAATAPGPNRDGEQWEEGNARFGLESMEGREGSLAR
jgi:hypothetical protein